MLRQTVFLRYRVLEVTLARTLKDIPLEKGYYEDWDNPFNQDEYQFLHRSELPTSFFQASLRKLPIPDKKMTAERYVRAVEGVGTPEQIAECKRVIGSLRTLSGNKLQTNLKAWDRKQKDTSYISEPWFDMYLKARAPLPVNYNPFMMISPDPRPDFNDQLLRATYLAISCGRFKKTMDMEWLEPEIFHVKPRLSDTAVFRKFVKLFPQRLRWFGAVAFQAFPLDMSQYPSLFGGTRVPLPRQDRLHRCRRPKHMLVARHGLLYAVQLMSRNYFVRQPQEIYSCLHQIVRGAARAREDECVAALTTLDRDAWAEARVELVNSSAKNAQNVKVIDDALFILCLDDTKETDHSKLANHLLCGEDGRNRWFDKCFQLIVDGNGQATVNFEHSWGDGVAVLRLVEEIYRDTARMDWIRPGDPPQGRLLGVEKLEWELNDRTKATINRARQDFLKTAANVGFATMQYTGLTRAQIKRHRLSPDSVMQLAIQLAYHRTHHSFAPTYESCSTAAFKKGRTECIRSGTVATRKAVEEIAGGQKDPKHLLHLFKQCSDLHGQLVKEAAMGHGVDRHLMGLKLMSDLFNLPLPEFFTSSIYAEMNHFQISTSTLSTESIVFGGFGPVVPDGYGIGYNVGKSRLGAVVSAFKASGCLMGATVQDQRDSKRFCENLEESLDIIGKVLNDE